MKLKISFVLLLYFGLTCFQGVCAENNYEVKRGMYPYMAFIYYSDPAVVDFNGQRFMRSAVLVHPDWLVTSAIGLMDPPDGFPTKTLLARTGAITIDSNLTLNEDEDEQEREIIQIVRPRNHSMTQWWTTDISLLKTLLPFNMTSAVGFKIPNLDPEVIDLKTCRILVYVKTNGNISGEKSLIMLFVELLPPTMKNCGSNFADDTMICAADSDKNKDATYDPDYCQGNSGGPLICDNEVVALQTYIENNCKEPHLYQLLSPWDKFINCSVENECQEDRCRDICDVNYKDLPNTAQRTTLIGTSDTSNGDNALVDDDTSTNTLISTSSAKDDDFDNLTPTTTTTTITTTITSSTTSSELLSNVTPTLTMWTTTENISETTELTTEPIEISTAIKQVSLTNANEIMIYQPKASENIAMKESTTPNKTTVPLLGSWPKEITPTNVFGENVTEKGERNPKVEAQQSEDSQHRTKEHKYGESNSNMCVIQTVLFGFTVFLCL